MVTEELVLHRRRNRPKSAMYSKSIENEDRLQTSPRVQQLMAAYGATNIGSQLLDSKEQTSKLERVMRELIDDELSQFRLEVQDAALTRQDSETFGTRTSVRSGNMDLKDLRSERLLMQRLGFVEHVDELDKRIKFFMDLQQKEAEARRKDYRERRMRMLVAQHTRRLDEYCDELDQVLEKVREECRAREEQLAEAHRRERDEFVERTLRTATCSDISATACNCPNRYICRHNKTARYRLRKRNPLVIKYSNAARRLRKNRRVAEAMEFEEKAKHIENEEKIRWTQQVQQNAIQTKLPVMVETQERQAKAMLERHRALLDNLEQQNKVKLSNLERVLECERQKADAKMMKLKASEFLKDDEGGAITSGRRRKSSRGSQGSRDSKKGQRVAGMSKTLREAMVSDVDNVEKTQRILGQMNVRDAEEVETNWQAPDETGLQNSNAIIPQTWASERKVGVWEKPKSYGLDNAPNLLQVAFAKTA